MKKKFFSASLALLSAFSLNAETLLDLQLRSPDDLKGWQKQANTDYFPKESGSSVLTISNADPKNSHLILYPLELKRIAGKRVTISAEVKRDLSVPSVRWQGGKLQLNYRAGNAWNWPGVYMAAPKCEWEKRTLTVDVPLDVNKADVVLGTQSASGTIRFRNLKVETGDTILPLKSAANMGFRDRTARDGKGGWSDQGPQNDAANFNYKLSKYANVPFGITAPERNDGKSIVVFQSAQLPNGVREVNINLDSAAVSGNYLYLLHTLTFGYGFKGTVGTVELTGKNGKTAVISVQGGKDVSDWWMPKRFENAFPGALWQNRSGGEVGVYVSKFRIPAELGDLASVRFRPAEQKVTWILLGATISEHDYPFPETSRHTIQANKVWRPLPVPASPDIISGSALDLTGILYQPPVGTTGRVVINKDGNFAFAKEPEKAVRFLSAVYLRGLFKGHGYFKSPLSSKKSTAEFVRQLKMQGYNMIRFHYLDSTLLEGAKEDFRLNPQTLDKFDYLIYCMKQNGIYANIDFMASRIGYSHGYSWSAAPGDKRQFKLDIFFQPGVRENWKRGVRALLTHVNPYTKTRLADDPVLAIAVSYNEQEFAWGMENLGQARSEWQVFLKSRYKTIEALRKAWGGQANGITGFEQIPAFTAAQVQENSPLGTDIARFIASKETELVDWYQNTARGLGFKGYLGTYTMAQSLRNIVSRRNSDYIALNSYHAHPFSNAIDTASSIARHAKPIRPIISVRACGKPLLATELGHAFWNPYRYEEGMVAGAYAAFQGIDGISPFAQQVTNVPGVHPVNTFDLTHDAILKSQEFLMAFLFRRGDVSRSENMVRVQIDPEAIFTTGTYSDALNADQSNLILVTGFATEVGGNGKAKKNEYLLPAAGGSSLLIRSIDVAGYTEVRNTKSGMFDFNRTLAELKRAGIVPNGNRTDAAKGIFESANGEILLNAKTNFMSVNTPRYQGICGEAGAAAKLNDFEVKSLGVRGNLSLVSLQNDKSLADASRMVMVFATNLLNSGMVFEDASFRTRLNNGTTPLLLETGTFRAVLKNSNARDLKLFALATNGQRIAELPLKKTDGTVEINVDTAKIPNGPAIYFELTTK